MSQFAFHIIGAGRSGTSLLAGLIDTHPECVVHFEEFSRNFLVGTASPDAETMTDAGGRTAARLANFIRACETRATAFPGRHWGHKTTTEHIWYLGRSLAEHPKDRDDVCAAPGEDINALETFVESVADIPTLFILRDGRTCVRSKVTRTGQSYEAAVHRWKYSLRVMNSLKERAANFLIVKFEDLILRPEETMRIVTSFLGVNYDAVVLSGTDNPKIQPEYRLKIFDRSKIAFEEGLHQRWIEEMRPELVTNGYVSG